MGLHQMRSGREGAGIERGHAFGGREVEVEGVGYVGAVERDAAVGQAAVCAAAYNQQAQQGGADLGFWGGVFWAGVGEGAGLAHAAGGDEV